MNRLRLLMACCLSIFGLASPWVQAEPVAIFAAGSLRGVVGDLSTEAKASLGIEVVSTFGGSGLMRERIEKGEQADLLLSADLGSPRKLAAEGRTVLAPLAFARNRMCVVSRKAVGVTQGNLVKKLLSPQVKLRTSTPVADPSGDYAWSIFDRIEAVQPGAGERLKEKARSMMTVSAEPTVAGQSAAAALFASGKADVSITYCSAAGALLKEVPGLSSMEIPAKFDPHPIYGVAVVTDRPAALKLALFLLSEQGQAILARNGLVPLVEPVASP